MGSKYACAVSNCTSALHLALRVTGVRPGDEVITVSHSFIATANSIRYCGATPVFIDILPDTFNINPALIASAITSRTRAILCVHQMGMPCDIQAITTLAHRHRIPVVEDAACAVGSKVLWEGKWEKIGRPHGDVACFSFHPRKVITTGDGGMLTTNDRDYDAAFRLLRQHSMSISDTVRHQAHAVSFEEYSEIGYNYRMTDIQAAVGRVQLRKLPSLVRARQQLAGRYTQLLSAITGITPPCEPPWAKSNWQSYCIRLPLDCDQVHAMQFLLDHGIATRRGIMCAHREKPYRTLKKTCKLPESEGAQDRCVTLPLYSTMTWRDQVAVVNTLRDAIRTRTRR